MAINPIVEKGLEISQFYYDAQQYFSSLILAAESVAQRLMDLGWRITFFNYGRPVQVAHWSWSTDRGAHLPRSYTVLFEKKGDSATEQETDQFGFSFCFFTSDPSGGQSWVPTGLFFRAVLIPEMKFETWKILPKIQEVARLNLLRPAAEAAFLQYQDPWPSTLSGDGISGQLQSISIVPFPLASISTSEDLEVVRDVAVKALLNNNPNILNSKYLQRFWAL